MNFSRVPWTGLAIKGVTDQTKCGCLSLVQFWSREGMDYILRLFIAENSRPADGKIYQKLLIALIKYIKRKKKKKQNPFLAKILATMFANS